MINIEVLGIKAVNQKLGRIQSGLSKQAKIVPKEMADLGVREAKSRVPVETGETQANIFKLNLGQESWVISRTAPSDDKPVNVFIDQGNLRGLEWGPRTSPKTGEFFFMRNTGVEIRKKMIPLLNERIEKIVK